MTINRENKVSVFSRDGVFENDLKVDSALSKPYFITCKDSNLIIIDEKNGYSRVWYYGKKGNLIRKFEKNEVNQKYLSYSADLDNQGNVYIAESQSASVLVFNNKGVFIRKIGGYGQEIRSDLNLGIGVEYDKNRKLQLKLGDYDSSNMKFDFITKIKIHKNLLFIANRYKIVITDLNGNIKGYIAGNHGSKIGEFAEITDFGIWDNKMYIADRYNNRILVYKIVI
jgi:hypothetical protein